MNIILLGFMGSGKTTVGKALAKAMAMDYIDTDEMIEEKLSMKIDDIFRIHGEDYFRCIEAETIAQLDGIKNTVISVGGGTVMNSESFACLKKLGKTVFLNTPMDKIINHLGGKFRPLVGHTIDRDKLETLLAHRMPVYLSADYVQDTTQISVDETVEKIIALFE